MRFSNRLVGLRRPDWKLVSIAIVWLVFIWNFLGLPILHQAKDPKSRMHDPIVPHEYYQASVDTAFAMQARAKSLGTDYRASQYAQDMFWLRAREDRVRHWLHGSSNAFANIVDNLHKLVLKSEEDRVVAECREKNQSEEVCRRMAQMWAFQTVSQAVDAARQNIPGFKPVSNAGILRALKRLGWHTLHSNLWAMLATMLMLLLRLGWSKQHKLREELLLAPGRFLWSCFWWGHGISEYPGSDLATDIRFVKLRNRYMRNKSSWELTRQEEAALWLTARQPVVRFEDALAAVAASGGMIAPRRTVFVGLLIALTSGSLAQRWQQAATTSVVTVKLTPESGELETFQLQPTGGSDQTPSDDSSQAIASQQDWEMPCVPVFGGAVTVVDKRRKFRTIRVMGSRAPPVFTGGV